MANSALYHESENLHVVLINVAEIVRQLKQTLFSLFLSNIKILSEIIFDTVYQNNRFIFPFFKNY